MTRWIVKSLGPDVPIHFTAFHPDWKMTDRPHTPPSTLSRARRIALQNGVHYAYTGNVHDEDGESTYCAQCGTKLIGRDWYTMTAWRLTENGACAGCGRNLPGVFEAEPGHWGAKRQAVDMEDFMNSSNSPARPHLGRRWQC